MMFILVSVLVAALIGLSYLLAVGFAWLGVFGVNLAFSTSYEPNIWGLGIVIWLLIFLLRNNKK